MNNIIWLVGAVVIVLFILGYFGLEVEGTSPSKTALIVSTIPRVRKRVWCSVGTPPGLPGSHRIQNGFRLAWIVA